LALLQEEKACNGQGSRGEKIVCLARERERKKNENETPSNIHSPRMNEFVCEISRETSVDIIQERNWCCSSGGLPTWCCCGQETENRNRQKKERAILRKQLRLYIYIKSIK